MPNIQLTVSKVDTPMCGDRTIYAYLEWDTSRVTLIASRQESSAVVEELLPKIFYGEPPLISEVRSSSEMPNSTEVNNHLCHESHAGASINRKSFGDRTFIVLVLQGVEELWILDCAADHAKKMIKPAIVIAFLLVGSCASQATPKIVTNIKSRISQDGVMIFEIDEKNQYEAQALNAGFGGLSGVEKINKVLCSLMRITSIESIVSLDIEDVRALCKPGKFWSVFYAPALGTAALSTVAREVLNPRYPESSIDSSYKNILIYIEVGRGFCGIKQACDVVKMIKYKIGMKCNDIYFGASEARSQNDAVTIIMD